MSSILDALNKLEEEQERARQATQPVTIDPAQAAQELISRDVLRDEVTLKVSPLVMVAGILLGFFVIVVGAVGMTLLALKGTPANSEAQTNKSIAVASADAVPPKTVPGEPEAASPGPSPIVETATPNLHKPAPRVAAPPKPAVQAVATAPRFVPPVPTEKVLPVPRAMAKEVGTESALPPVVKMPDVVVSPRDLNALPEVTASGLPSGEAMSVGETRLPPPPPRRVAAAEIATPVSEESLSAERDIASYPVFTRSVQADYGLKKLRINMLRPRTEAVPYPSAVINMVTIFEGETILNSSARLFKVESHGVGIEIARSGERYYLKF